jgi:hypothetical protein
MTIRRSSSPLAVKCPALSLVPANKVIPGVDSICRAGLPFLEKVNFGELSPSVRRSSSSAVVAFLYRDGLSLPGHSLRAEKVYVALTAAISSGKRCPPDEYEVDVRRCCYRRVPVPVTTEILE